MVCSVISYVLYIILDQTQHIRYELTEKIKINDYIIILRVTADPWIIFFFIFVGFIYKNI